MFHVVPQSMVAQRHELSIIMDELTPPSVSMISSELLDTQTSISGTCVVTIVNTKKNKRQCDEGCIQW
jgi:hypothetical protein